MGWLTLVRKNSDEESLEALKEETCTNRSMSYLATASAMRSAPSTCTSSRVKFLDAVNPAPGSWTHHKLGGVVSANEVVDNI